MGAPAPNCVICGRPVDHTLVYGHLGWMHEACVPPAQAPAAAAHPGRVKLTSQEKLIAVVFSVSLLSLMVWLGFGDGFSSNSTREAHEAERQRESALEAHAQDSKRRQEVEARERAAERQALIEAQRPPAERAALAVEALSAPSVQSICRARKLLEPIAEKERSPDVKAALTILRQQETIILRSDRPAFEERRSIVCRDGSFSPTCKCKGPRRGCCSHHGGVAGCESYPTAVSCPP